jgi:hypothetical protein
MPWSDLSYDEKIKVYKELFKARIESPPDPDLAIFEMMVRSAILHANLTKRQMIILNFIMTLSFAFQKREAVIPKLKDFELAGINSRKIKEELKKLIDMKVIKWNRDENLFSIEDPREWETPYNAGFNIHRARDLFYMNIVHSGIDIQPLLKFKKSLE